MTDQEKQRIAVMRSVGESYKEIAKTLNLSLNTVQTFCRRNMLTGKRAGSSGPEDLSMPKIYAAVQPKVRRPANP